MCVCVRGRGRKGNVETWIDKIRPSKVCSGDFLPQSKHYFLTGTISRSSIHAVNALMLQSPVNSTTGWEPRPSACEAVGVTAHSNQTHLGCKLESLKRSLKEKDDKERTE